MGGDSRLRAESITQRAIENKKLLLEVNAGMILHQVFSNFLGYSYLAVSVGTAANIVQGVTVGAAVLASCNPLVLGGSLVAATVAASLSTRRRYGRF